MRLQIYSIVFPMIVTNLFHTPHTAFTNTLVRKIVLKDLPLLSNILGYFNEEKKTNSNLDV